MTKASNNEFPSVLFDEQAGDPSTPASGFWRAYFKSDGLYVIDDAGVVTGPFGTGGGAGTIAGTILAPSSDTYIDSQNATTNHDTNTVTVIGGSPSNTTFSRRGLFTFDTSSLAGETIHQARLRMYLESFTTSLTTGVAMTAQRILRAYVANQVTWNVYSTGNNWTTAGARGLGTDSFATFHHLGHFMANAGMDPCWYDFDLTTLLKESLDASETTLRFWVQFDDADTSDNATTWSSKDSATAAQRPTLQVLYE